MSRRFPPRVRMTCATTGTGTLTLGTAISGSQAVPASYDGAEMDYAIIDGADWEEGWGVYTHATTQLTRNLIASSTGAKLNLSGAATVFSTIASATIEHQMVGVDELVGLTSFPAANLLDIEDIPQTYRHLALVISAASCTVASRRLLLRTSSDNGASFATSGYVTGVMNAAGAVDGLTNNISFPAVIQPAASLESRMVLITGYQSGCYTFASFVGTQTGVSSPVYHGQGFYFGDRAAVDALRLIWDGTGNFDGTGSYALYGIR